ncbi:MAG: ATP-binding cassette domain-containing protein [Terrimonas sp.]|nr:ATP-binding cassette domain-containing protein [Terrimonas sp.]
MFLSLHHITVKRGSEFILKDIGFCIREQEQWAITGPVGSGKTTLAKVITGSIFYQGQVRYYREPTPAVMLVEQQHRFKNLSNTQTFYYQQRFNSFDAEDSQTLREAFESFTGKNITEKKIAAHLERLHLTELFDKPLVQLSNGENKRLQLAEALASAPDMLILDNPFTGLDIEGRKTLHQIINDICRDGTQIVLITDPANLPACITHIATLTNGTLHTYNREEFPDVTWTENNKAGLKDLLDKFQVPGQPDFDCAVIMKDVSVQYGDKMILDHINWQVKRGECWSISGPNGAGKSTLLSLVTADNPQAYANMIWLFDKRRGQGESIWDIKKMIGYVSPEMHLAFDPGYNSFEVVASGLFDTIGLFRKIHPEQEEQILQWMKIMEIEQLARKNLLQLSLGQQRMVLLARALVKNPPMLVLDEPCQGLDDAQSDFFNSMVNELCAVFGTTLLYVTHIPERMPDAITHYLSLENGKLVR